MKNILHYVYQHSQTLLEACLPSHCLLCHLPSKQSLICQCCYDAILTERPCCLHCGCGLNSSQAYCGECLKHPFSFQQLHAIAGYQAPFPKLIKQLKYNGQILYADLLGLLLAHSIQSRYNQQQLQSIDYIIAVPLHIKKHRSRGFNQAQLIKDALIKHLPMLTLCQQTLSGQLIIRNKSTTAQEGLSRKQRQYNLNNAFSLTTEAGVNFQGKNIVLIDDVVTTGATINSLCQCLLAANVKTIDVWCICRTELT
ncbi:ComF family protein [Psychromonas sp. SR45-3]|uniref:ComF family protein n=1 Tax=Psychromonas sp. SR45-3 TaxID=2760930 RepID=UPI0021760D23|nr:phosphoribosyltransferase family protein [Psychromonas sp. SR45-3]